MSAFDIRNVLQVARVCSGRCQCVTQEVFRRMSVFDTRIVLQVARVCSGRCQCVTPEVYYSLHVSVQEDQAKAALKAAREVNGNVRVLSKQHQPVHTTRGTRGDGTAHSDNTGPSTDSAQNWHSGYVQVGRNRPSLCLSVCTSSGFLPLSVLKMHT